MTPIFLKFFLTKYLHISATNCASISFDHEFESLSVISMPDFKLKNRKCFKGIVERFFVTSLEKNNLITFEMSFFAKTFPTYSSVVSFPL